MQPLRLQPMSRSRIDTLTSHTFLAWGENTTAELNQPMLD